MKEAINMVKSKLKFILLAAVISLFFFILMAKRPAVGQESKGGNVEASVNQKLDQILKNQLDIVARIEATKEEIIRLRKWSR